MNAPERGLGTLAEIAARLGGRVRGDGSLVVTRIASIDDVDRATLTFATDAHYLRAALASGAAGVLVDEAIGSAVDASKPLVLVASARAALAELLESLESPRPHEASHHPSAVVDPSATIGARVVIGPLASIGAGAVVGDGCIVAAGAVIGAGARLGADSTVHPRAMLLDGCIAGERVVLQAGAVVGSDGFGYAFVGGGYRKIPQIGNVELGDDVEIGANTCVDRAQTGTTRIGTGTKIDNLVQIGHNCRIGKHSAFAGHCALAGSTIVGDYVRVGGASLFKGHITVGSNVTVGGHTEVWSDVPDGAFISGKPAQPHRDYLRLQVLIHKLPKLFGRVDALEGKASRPRSKD